MQSLQRILWRENKEATIDVYELQTVTYGTSPTSYLSTCYLKHLAIEYESVFPDAARAIKEDFYMYDLLTGGNDVEFVLKLRRDILYILEKGEFNLRKFVANASEILQGSSHDNVKHVFRDQSEIKTLGILWEADSDFLRYEVSFDETPVFYLKGMCLVT